MGAAGNLYTPESDLWSVRPPLFHRGAVIQGKPKRIKVKNEWIRYNPPQHILKDISIKPNLEQPEIIVNQISEILEGCRPTLRLILSKTMGVYDSSGILAPLVGQLRHCVRIATKQTLGKYDEEVSKQLYDHWLLCYVECLRATRWRYPKLNNALTVSNQKFGLVIMSDASIAQVVVAYLIHFLENGSHSVTHILGKSYLSNEGQTIPDAELSAACVLCSLLFVSTVKHSLAVDTSSIFGSVTPIEKECQSSLTSITLSHALTGNTVPILKPSLKTLSQGLIPIHLRHQSTSPYLHKMKLIGFKCS